MRRATHRLATVISVIGLGFVLTATILATGPPAADAATAHARLASSEPARGATLDAPPARVSVTFALKPATIEGDPLAVYGPAGGRIDTRRPEVSADEMVLAVDLAAGHGAGSGDYQIVYRLVSQDNHLITGRIPFTVRAAGTPTATPAGDEPADDGSSGATTGTAPTDRPTGDDRASGGDERTLSHGFAVDHRPASAAALVLVLVLVLVLAGLIGRRRGRAGRHAPAAVPRHDATRRPSDGRSARVRVARVDVSTAGTTSGPTTPPPRPDRTVAGRNGHRSGGRQRASAPPRLVLPPDDRDRARPAVATPVASARPRRPAAHDRSARAGPRDALAPSTAAPRPGVGGGPDIANAWNRSDLMPTAPTSESPWITGEQAATDPTGPPDAGETRTGHAAARRDRALGRTRWR